MKEYRIGDMSIDINHFHRAEIQSTGESGVTLTGKIIKVSNNFTIKVISNFKGIDAECTIVTDGNESTLVIATDRNTSSVIRDLPKPCKITYSNTDEKIQLVIEDMDKIERAYVTIFNKCIQRAYMEGYDGEPVASATLLGDRVSGFISNEYCDEIKLQMLCAVIAVLISNEMKSGNRLMDDLFSRSSAVGVIIPGQNYNMRSLRDILNAAIGNKE